MRSPLHRALRPRRSFLAALPLLALALLAPSQALACGATSAEKTYCLEPAEIESGESIQHQEPKRSTTRRGAGTDATPANGEEPAETPTEPGGEPNSAEGRRSHAAPPPNGGNHPGGGNSADGVSQGHAVAASQSSGKSAAPRSEGPSAKGVQASASSGGSSPVLPILIAVAVLAAISIAIVVYRERRGGDGEAGYTGAGG